MRGAAKLPKGDLAHRHLAVENVSGVFYRCANETRPLIDWSTRASARFSHPHLPFPVLYLAEDKLTGFWECFSDELNDQPPDQRALSITRHLASRHWVRFNIDSPLKVLDTTRPTVLRMFGADGATFLADYSVTQKWSEALMTHPTKLDGFFYRSRLDSDKRCLALFGRPHLLQHGKKKLSPHNDSALLQDPEFLQFLVAQEIALL